jgi:enamine deaminase RidA (YjgF/YER057c/UK114 family)
MQVRALSPPTIRPPFARYSHGIAVPAGCRLVFASGQLGIGADETIPPGCAAQAALCFANVAAILAEDGMTLADVIHVRAFVTDRAFMADYMRIRDEHFPGVPPASTLMIVSGFTLEKFVVEVEVVAAANG